MMSRFRDPRIVLAVLSAIPVGVLLLVTAKFKLGLSPDGANYMSMAQGIASGNGVAVANILFESGWQPISVWPPFYPLIVAILLFMSVDMALAVWIINLVSLFLTLFLSALLFFRTSGSLRASGVFVLLISISGPLLNLHSWALSEPVFILLTTCYFWALLKFLETGKMLWFAALICTVVSMTFTRYIGGLLLPLTALFLLWKYRVPLLRRLLTVSGFCFFTVLPMMWWSRRNRLMTGESTGAKVGDNIHSFYDNLVIAAKTSESWFFPEADLSHRGALWFMAAIAIVVIFLLYKRRAVVNIVMSVFCFVFWPVTVCLSSLLFIWWPDDRLLSSVFLPLVFVIFGGFYAIYARQKGIAKLLLMAALVMYVAASVPYQLRWVERVVEAGADGTRGQSWVVIKYHDRQKTILFLTKEYWTRQVAHRQELGLNNGHQDLAAVARNHRREREFAGYLDG